MNAVFPVIETKRFILRQILDSDLENIFKGLSHPEVIKYYGVSYDSLEATRFQMKFFTDLLKNKTGIWWAVCSLKNDIFYGAGGLNNLNTVHRKAEIGFWLIPEYWQQGIMQETLPLICDYGFNQLGLHRIEGFVESENRNCIRAIEKLNFQHEGIMKECEMKNGRFISLNIYAKLKT